MRDSSCCNGYIFSESENYRGAILSILQTCSKKINDNAMVQFFDAISLACFEPFSPPVNVKMMPKQYIGIKRKLDDDLPTFPAINKSPMVPVEQLLPLLQFHQMLSLMKTLVYK
jgi:hypothetical protein